ncbi:MAG: hypothetical protein C5B48_04155 [Candidatus Rokuibacteriota bacterium]|nr:MAG: hypothetical protein C5B48_04155 [Candidatus Rokubacteria bacterium]
MGELLALLDLGSNATRLSLVRIDPGAGFRILRAERVQTRLGGGPPGKLAREAIDLTVTAVQRFLGSVTKSLNGSGRPRVVAVATAAVREAANRDYLVDALRRREGITLRILSGEEEGRLGALAALQTLRFRDGLVTDLGGGSLQMTRVYARKVVSVVSLPLGAVRLTRQFLSHDPPTPVEMRALREEVRDLFRKALPPAHPGFDLIGLGGTVRALARLHLAHCTPRASHHWLRLRGSDITALRERLAVLPLRKRRRLRGLKAERADIILAGALITEELMMFGGYVALTVCTARVHDGILWREALDGGAER